MKQPTVSVIGLGKLGLPFAACLAARGLRVIGVDLDPLRVAAVRDGRPLGCEPQLAETLASTKTTLTATADLEEAVRASDATFILVQTPQTSHGEISVDYVLEACRGIGTAMARKAGYHLVAITSTMPPGTIEAAVLPILERGSGKVCGRDFGLCYAPEFAAQGSLVEEFLRPRFVLIGQHDAPAGDVLARILGVSLDPSVEIVRCGIAAAELAKIALNAFLATKISFANLLAMLCERTVGVDVDEVTAILERDPRVGRGFLQGRMSFGGPCLPRDLKALGKVAESAGVDPGLTAAVERINDDRLRDVELLVCDRARTLQGTRKRPVTVGVLGLSFKAGTDSAEDAPGALLAERLAQLGLRVIAHDPVVAKRIPGVLHAATASECVAEADVLFIATAWPEYAELSADSLARTIVIDCWRVLPPSVTEGAGEYVCLGVGGLFEAAAETERQLALSAKV